MTDDESSSTIGIQEMNEEDWFYISGRLGQYNIEKSEGISRKPGKPVNLVLKDGQDTIGGFAGRTIYMSLLIDHLWVDERFRGRGYGTRLVREGERLAKEEGCISSQTSSYSFQAPEFYQKLGYVVFGTFERYPNGIKKFYLGKDL